MFENGTDALANVTAILAILAAVGWLFRFLYKAVKAINRVEESIPTLLGIAAEFQPNGGNSLKDHVKAIRSEQARVAEALKDHIDADADVQKILATQLDEINVTLKRMP